MTRHLPLPALAVALVLWLAGCGSNTNTPPTASAPATPNPTSDPVEVAKTYYNAWFGCGDQGTARQWDLKVSRYGTRAQALAEDRRGGCRPSTPPQLTGVVGPSEGDRVVVVLKAPTDPDVNQQMVLVRQGETWKVDDDGGEPQDARPWAGNN